MSMVTELELVEQKVVGGEKIAVHKWSTQNYHLHQCVSVLSRLTIAMLEMDSNNSTGAVVLSDSEDINSEWTRFKDEWALAKKYRHLAPAAQEKTLFDLHITDAEGLRVNNARLKRLCDGVATLVYKMLFSDSGKLQYGLTDRDIDKFDKQIGYVEEVLKMYVGEGKEGSLGREVPAFEYVGTVVPPLNLHETVVGESSPAAPANPNSDAPDIASSIYKSAK